MAERRVSTENETQLAIASLILVSLLVASYGLMARVMNESFSPTAQVVFRSLVGLAITFLLVRFGTRAVRLTMRQTLVNIVLGVSFGSAGLLYTISVNKIDLANSIFLFQGGSLLTSVAIGTVLFKEPLARLTTCAIVIAIIGLALLTGARPSLEAGSLIGLASGLIGGIGNASRRLMRGVPRKSVLFYQSIVVVVWGAILLAIFNNHAVHTVHVSSILVGVAYGSATIVASTLLLYGFTRFDVSRGSLILTSELVFSVLLGIAVYDEIPSVAEAFGCALIFIACCAAALRRKPA